MSEKKFLKVICTSSYDGLTQFLDNLLQSTYRSDSEVLFYNTGNQNLSYCSLAESNSIDEKSILIFGGHAGRKALYMKRTDTNKTEIFYDKSSFHCGPKVIVAFACYAGASLGEDFVRETGGSFLGYNRMIAFADEESCTRWWKEILISITENVFRDQKITEDTAEKARQIYRETYERFHSGKESSHRYAMWMKMCLLRQQNSLCISNPENQM